MVLVPGSPESEGEMPSAPGGDDEVQRGARQGGRHAAGTACARRRLAKVRFDGGERTVDQRIVARYWIWQRPRRGDRVAQARTFDGGVEIELRQIFEADDFGEELTPELREANSAARADLPRVQRSATRCDRRRLADRVGPADRRADSLRPRRVDGRGSGPGRARCRARAVAGVGHPGQTCLAHGHCQAPGHRRAAPPRARAQAGDHRTRATDPAAARPARALRPGRRGGGRRPAPRLHDVPPRPVPGGACRSDAAPTRCCRRRRSRVPRLGGDRRPAHRPRQAHARRGPCAAEDPGGRDELDDRLPAVLEAYLVFNEGYAPRRRASGFGRRCATTPCASGASSPR